MEPDAWPNQYGQIPVVEHESRFSFSQFMEAHGHRLSVINGMEVRSITHQRCTQLILTGKGGNKNIDDWPSILAANTKKSYPIPYLVFRGPSYSSNLAQNVIRVGDNGQLSNLLNPDQITGFPAISSNVEEMEEELLVKRIGRQLRNDKFGNEAKLLQGYQDIMNQYKLVQNEVPRMDLQGVIEGCVRDIRNDASNAFTLFENDHARAAMISYKGVCNLSWDTHADHFTQQENYQDFFWYLGDIMNDLLSRTSMRNVPLIDEVVVVVFSEMGRAPIFNPYGGRDHWTFTSAFLFGGGIRGNQSIGGLGDDAIGQKVDLNSGESSNSGALLLPQHFGATLLALGDVDYRAYVDANIRPIQAIIDG